MAAYCQNCGSTLHLSARFCSGCGAAVPVLRPEQRRPLVRPRAGRAIAGVCAGIAQANGWDVVLVRVLTLLLCIFSSGLVAVAYLAAWIGIPEETAPYPGAYPPVV